MDNTEKRGRIDKAAATLFAKYGYKKTAVDDIVAEAGVSKGLFYHYYPNKAALYVALYQSYADMLSRRINQEVNLEESDFFARLKQLAHIRISFLGEHSDLWPFLYAAYYETHPDVAEKIKEKNEDLLRESAHGSASHLDWRGLKRGVSPDAVIELVTWIAEGFVRKVNADGLRLDEGSYRDFDHYMQLLKHGLYEREEE